MSKIENIVQYILDTQPHTHGNNTELCIAVWKYVWESKTMEYGHTDSTENMIYEAIRDYPPESITRKRRELVKSTDKQHEKGYKTWKHFSQGIGDNPLDN